MNINTMIHDADHNNLPLFIKELAATPPMQRLKKIGMNCGCNYSSLPLYQGMLPYNRYEHSINVALIVWHFTGNMTESIAALFHDIATPAFAHSIDFLNGDYLTQESTEEHTETIIRSSKEICDILDKYGIQIPDIIDYHLYPIADNDSPRLSSDRLEYTLGNAYRYKYADIELLQRCFDDLVIGTNEEGNPELMFTDIDIAAAFGEFELRCSHVYSCHTDRYVMQILAEIVKEAMAHKIISMNDLYTGEAEVIDKLMESPITAPLWEDYTGLHELVTSEEEAPYEKRRVIPAKKRYIDPYVKGQGRLSAIHPEFNRQKEEFLAVSHENWVCMR